jgi:hypothetical protein
VKELTATPKAPFGELAARAAIDVGEAYQHGNLAQSEHAQLTDPATGQILEAPFKSNSTASAPPAAPGK